MEGSRLADHILKNTSGSIEKKRSIYSGNINFDRLLRQEGVRYKDIGIPGIVVSPVA